LRDAYWALRTAENRQDIARVEDLLWQTAVALEQGGLLTMAEQLRRLQQALAQAMAQGAPQNEIDALLKRYQDLLQRYLQALAQNAPQNNAPLDPNAKLLGEQDLAALLKAIEELSQSGDRLKAMQLLAMLQGLIENMQVTNGSGGSSGMGAAEDQALRDLSEMMGRQRMLLDKTFRQSQGNGDPKDGGPKGLARQQSQLQNDFGAIFKKSGKGAGQEDLQQAQKMMGDAAGALGIGDLPRAGTLEKDVLDALRKAAEAVASGRGKPGQGNQDPFGRVAGNRGTGGGGDVRIPDAAVLQRARDILNELRKRAGEQGRPKEELDYIDRLLKQF